MPADTLPSSAPSDEEHSSSPIELRAAASAASDQQAESTPFTPGPWMVPARMKTVVSQGTWHTIAVCEGPAHPIWTLTDSLVMEANARLIAAAPDLYETLIDVLNDFAPPAEADETAAYWRRASVLRARAALAKAEGRQ